MPSVEELKERLAKSLKARRLDTALSALSQLAKAQPDEPNWPRRAARLFRQRSDSKREVGALRRALEIQVDQGLVLDAIASCQAILDRLPQDARTLETLDLLYLEGTPLDAPADERGKGGGHSMLEAEERPLDELPPLSSSGDEPLDSLVLTDVVPGARALAMGDAEPGAIIEIPLEVEFEGESQQEIDLRLDDWSSNRDFKDVAAAQAVCLPKPSRDGAGQAASSSHQRGASLRSELANIPLFGDLDPASLHTLIRRVRVVAIEAGQILFRQGDPANSLYVIVEGAVVPIAEGHERRKLAVLDRGAFFGEIGLMTKQPRNATIEALVDTKLLAIDRKLMWELIEREPSVAQGMLRFLRDRLIDRQIRTNPLFSAFARAERAAMAKQFRFVEVEPGTTLVSCGRPPEGLFVVLSGSLAILDRGKDPRRAPEKELGTLGLGDVFGGLSLIDGAMPNADVVARTKCWLVVLGERRFRRILEANPRLDRVLRRIAHPPDEESRPGRVIAL